MLIKSAGSMCWIFALVAFLCCYTSQKLQLKKIFYDEKNL